MYSIETAGDGFWSNKKKHVAVTRVEIEENNYVQAYFDPETWDVQTDGLIYTDSAFLKQLVKCLKSDKRFSGVCDWDSLEYTEQGLQTNSYVSLEVLSP